MIASHGFELKRMQTMRIFAEEPTCRKCGQQEETAEHLLFDFEALEQVRLVWCQKGSGILCENKDGCTEGL